MSLARVSPETAESSETIVKILLRNCELHRDKTALHWLNEQCDVERSITYGELASRSFQLARNLAEGLPGVAKGERAVLCYPPGLDFIEAFLACVRAGIVAVPVRPPDAHHPLESFLAIVKDSQAACILTNDSFMDETYPSIRDELEFDGAAPWFSTTTMLATGSHGRSLGEDRKQVLCEESTVDPSGTKPEWNGDTTLSSPQLEDIAFLLYQSELRGPPQGMVVTHAILFHNLRAMEVDMKADSTMVEVSFLPHYLAMGLLASYLQPLYVGGTAYFMSSLTYDTNPGLWLQALSKFKGTHSKASNRVLEQIPVTELPQIINLSSVRFIMNASDHIRPDTNHCVESILLPYGLQSNTVQSGYGFTERTLYVCSSQEEAPTTVRGYISRGTPPQGTILKIVDPKSCTEAADGEMGEIWLHSPLVTPGYWGDTAKEGDRYHGRLSGNPETVYLRTRDIGVTSDGHVFIFGAAKGIVTIESEPILLNYIESRVEGMMALRSNGSIAFVYERESVGEAEANAQCSIAIWLVAELHAAEQYTTVQLQDFAKKISTLVTLEFNFKVSVIAFTTPHTLSDSSSASPHQRRVIAKKQLKDGLLNEVYRWTASEIDKTKAKSGELISGTPTSHELHEEQQARSSLNGDSSSLAHTAITDEQEEHVEPVQQRRMLDTGVPKYKGRRSYSVTPTSHGLHDVSLLDSDSSMPSSLVTIAVEDNFDDSVLQSRKVDTEMPKYKSRRSHSVTPTIRGIHSSQFARMKRSASISPRHVLESVCTRSQSVTPSKESTSSEVGRIAKCIGKVLGVKLAPESNIWACGCTSLMAVTISQKLQREFGFAVQPHVLFTHQTPNALLGKLQSNLLGLASPDDFNQSGYEPEIKSPTAVTPDSKASTAYQNKDIAIIGMAGIFASCTDTNELWKMMLRKEVVMTSVQLPPSGRTIFGAFTEDMGHFDYKFFGITKWEASTIDPQQSILLHLAWECLQNAGYGSGRSLDAIKGTDVGVFIGATSSDARVVGQSSEPLPPGTSFVGAITANRISYFFDFKGPSVAVDTACGASLSALHAACSALRLGECSAALVGGVNAMLDANGFLFLANMGMLSPEGRARVFDSGANGYLRGEGGGVVLLKRLVDAEKDGDRILSVIKSVVTNHNGTSATPTSPNCLSQQKLLRQSLKCAGLQPDEICYIEAHGSGTKLGDPIEVDAIVETFCKRDFTKGEQRDGKRTKRSHPLMLGSVKANIGHLEQGAGIAGLIKTIMVLEHERAPGNACLEDINPAFTFDPSQIKIPKEDVSLETYHSYCEWEDPEEEFGVVRKRLLSATINSFGFGGANVNAIIQQYTFMPHLGRTKLGLVLDRGSFVEEQESGKLLSETIGHLSFKLKAFNESYCHCMETLDRVLTKLKGFNRATLLQNPEVLSFCLLYGMAEVVTAQGAEIAFVGGTDVCAELVALVVADAIALSDTFRFLLMGLDPNRFNLVSKTPAQTSKLPTEIPFYSSVTATLYHPPKFSEDYLSRLIPAIGAMNGHHSGTQMHTIPPSSVVSMHKPLLRISLIADDTRVDDTSLVIQLCRNRFLMQELREKFLEVRQENDQMALASCPSRPSREVPMPKFYERYPLRALLDGILLTQPTTNPLPHSLDHGTRYNNESEGHMRKLSCSANRDRIDSVSSYDTDPGYITQATSSESLGMLTPLPSPNKVSTDPALPNGHNHGPHGMELTELSKESTPKPSAYEPPIDALVTPKQVAKLVKQLLNKEEEENKKTLDTVSKPSNKAEIDKASPAYQEMLTKVLGELQEEIKEDLDDPDLPVDEMAASGIFQLGLDSLSVMQIASFIMTKYKVNKSFVELVNCDTMGGIAETVLHNSPVFTVKLPLKQEEVDPRYPRLTKGEYYTIPSLERLRALSTDHLTHVENFTVARVGYGKVMFLGKTDITGLKLDDLVDIETLYAKVRFLPEQPRSSSLNRPALLLFENVHPKEKTEEEYTAMLVALKGACKHQETGIEVLEYDGPSGKVVMKVDHFY